MKNPRQNKKNVYLMLITKKCQKKSNNGSFWIINLAQSIQTGATYATKTNIIQNSKQHKLFISRAARFLIHVEYLTIIQFRGFSYIHFNNITILMDYMKNGSLANIIEDE